MARDPASSSPRDSREAGGLAEISEGVESGAGLPELVRAAARTLDASLALIDKSSAVLAVAAASPDEERRLLEGGEGVESVSLELAGERVGELRVRRESGAAESFVSDGLARLVSNLLALELERSRSGEWAVEEAAGDFVRAVISRQLTDRRDILARAADLGTDLEGGGGVVMARVAPRTAQTGDWRERTLTFAARGLRAAAPGALLAFAAGPEASSERREAELVAIVPSRDETTLARSSNALSSELEIALPGFAVTVGSSRLAHDPSDLFRAGQEARLALNVGEADGAGILAFDQTGSYRLLLPAMSESPEELEGFFSETIEPLVSYDGQYETDLVATVEAYLENDGNVARTAERMFTHRHTIRYRLERVKEICGHDATSTEGREKLGLGLKSMRVLGIAGPGGPATEPGTEAGSVPRKTSGPD